MCFHEFTDAVEEHYIGSFEWQELATKAEEEKKDIDAAWDEIRDEMGDNVYADLSPLVEGWIMRHGCQITSHLDEVLAAQEPMEDDEDDDEDLLVDDEEDMV